MGAGGEKLSQAHMQLFEHRPVVSEMFEQGESQHAPVHLLDEEIGQAVRAARSGLQIFYA